MFYIKIIILGIIEGLTEFIPVSSTGHLILASEIINCEMKAGFEIIIQLGAILAVCFVYHEKLLFSALNIGRSKEANRFILNLSIACVPAFILGFMFHSFIKEVLFSPLVVSISLIVGGIIIILVEKFHTSKEKYDAVDDFNIWLSLKIGFCQVLAMIPGTSRSGATIIGALLLGVSRRAATEFSFFLAIPTMVGATAYDIYKNYDLINGDNIIAISIGFIVAFFSAFLVVKWLLVFVAKHNFIPFGIYRIIIGIAILALTVTTDVFTK